MYKLQLRYAVAAAAAFILLMGCGSSSSSPDTHLVSTSVSGSGSVSPSSRTVEEGSTTTFTISPDEGYSASVSGCGGSLSGTTYTTGAINSPCTVTATFTRITFTVEATISAGGTVTPDNQTVDYGDSAVFELSLDTGYDVAEVEGCSGSMSGNQFTTAPMVAACDVHFELVDTLAVSFTQTNVDLGVLGESGLDLDALVLTTMFSEQAVAGGAPTQLEVLQQPPYELFFVSDGDGEPKAILLADRESLDAGDIEITLEGIAMGLMMSSPLLASYDFDERLEILNYAIETEAFESLVEQVEEALMLEAGSLLRYAVFPRLYDDSVALLLTSIEALGGDQFGQNQQPPAMFSQSLHSVFAAVGEEDSLHLQNLTGESVMVLNPTLAFYGIDVGGEYHGITLPKARNWRLGNRGDDEAGETRLPLAFGEHDIALMLGGDHSEAARHAATANLLKSTCLLIDLVSACPLRNELIVREANLGFSAELQDVGVHFMENLGSSPQEIYIKVLETLNTDDNWNLVLDYMFSGLDGRNVNGRHLEATRRYINQAQNAIRRLARNYQGGRIQVPYAVDLMSGPRGMEWCVEHQEDTLEATCVVMEPTARAQLVVLDEEEEGPVVWSPVLLDATASYAEGFDISELEYRWDLNNDGVFDTEWSYEAQLEHTFTLAGYREVVLEVRNPAGRVGRFVLEMYIESAAAGGSARRIIAFADAAPWGSSAFQTVMEENGWSEGDGEYQFQILPSSEMENIILTPGYDMLVVLSDQPQTFYNNMSSHIARFERFIANGGVMFLGACDSGWQGGSMRTAGIEELPGSVAYTNAYDNWNYLAAPDAPLMQDVPEEMYGTYASHVSFGELPENATVFTVDSSDEATLLEYELGSGYIIVTGQPLEFAFDRGQDTGVIYPRVFSYVLGRVLDEASAIDAMFMRRVQNVQSDVEASSLQRPIEQ